MLAALLLFDDPSTDIEIGMDLNEVYATRDGGSRGGDQIADTVKKAASNFHRSPRIVCNTLAASASSEGLFKHEKGINGG